MDRLHDALMEVEQVRKEILSSMQDQYRDKQEVSLIPCNIGESFTIADGWVCTLDYRTDQIDVFKCVVEEGSHLMLHNHPQLEFVVVEKGELAFTSGRRTLTVKRDDRIIVEPYEYHSAVALKPTLCEVIFHGRITKIK